MDTPHLTAGSDLISRDLLEGLLPQYPAGTIALLDIDSTIMDTAPRNYRILQEAAAEIPALAPAVARVQQRDLGWNVVSTVERYGPLTPSLRENLLTFWEERFFTDAYVLYDRPYPGVVELLQWMHRTGTTIVYLTGRDDPNMAAGTRKSFAAHRLPMGDRTEFIFKPTFEMADAAFKAQALDRVRAMGPVWVAIENEPANANIMVRALPETPVLLVDTVTSPNPEPLLPRIRVFAGYHE